MVAVAICKKFFYAGNFYFGIGLFIQLLSYATSEVTGFGMYSLNTFIGVGFIY